MSGLPARAHLERIRTLLEIVNAPASGATPLARQAAALDLAREEVPWLVSEFARVAELLLLRDDEVTRLSAQLDDCQESLERNRLREQLGEK